MHVPPSVSPSRAPAAGIAAALLSNGAYRVAIDALGHGFSACGPHLLTAWNADRSGDPGGLRLYLRERGSGSAASPGGDWCELGRRREGGSGDDTDARLELTPGVARLTRAWNGLEIELSVWVAPEHDIEFRQVTLHNPGSRARTLEWTSFAEIVLHDPAAHESHPIFSKLFLQTAWAGGNALLAERRPRGADESFPTLVHAVLDAPVLEFESDRGRFVGRGYPAHAPRALRVSDPLSSTVGNVLDPALSLRTRVEVAAGGTRSVTFVLGMGADRDAALALVDRYAAESARVEAREVAAALERLRRAAAAATIGLPAAAELASTLGSVLCGTSTLVPGPQELARARGTRGDLAARGIPTNAMLGCVHLEGPAGASALEPALALHDYATRCGVPATLVVIANPAALQRVRKIDGVLAFDDASVSEHEREQITAFSAWVGRDASIPTHAASTAAIPLPALGITTEAARTDPTSPAEETLLHPIEHGGFSADGREYVIRMRRRDDGSWSRPPRPWTNVLANENFGTLCSETGAGNTWSGNSREHRLTPWANDSVLDPHGEACFLRDEASGSFWSPLPGPAPDGDAYEMRHGFGASRCTHHSHGIEQRTTIFVPRHDPVRIVVLRLRELEGRARRLSLFDHHQLVLGSQSAGSARAIRTSIESESRVALARNGEAGPHAGGTVFVSLVAEAVSTRATEWRASGDRTAFLGRGGSLEAPRALRERLDLEGSCGAGLDPCLTQQLAFELPAHGAVEIALLFGEGADRAAIEALRARYGSGTAIAEELERVEAFWVEHVERIRVSTPSSALDLMFNGWLAYQTVACRLWARSAFYQSGGAFGFRDQMQDAVALVGLWPELAREQILLHAAHQFVEGDVLHWWHPPHSRGLRTRFADDLLWLPHLTAHYLRVTGDDEVLDEIVPFRRARLLEEGEDEVFLATTPAPESATLFEHACRAVDRSLRTGAHGLPLFGTGDWNDGMNRVGREGRGESVWMGFFLFVILGEWIPWCERRGENERADRYRTSRAKLQEALEQAGWDGHWYRRGYYDDGAPLGSAQSDECQIDALAQAWSVMSGAATPARAREAMAAVASRLVDEEHGIVRLLDPPFVNTEHDPGYIKGYVAGVRENGGQYTHAALWVVRAFAELGDHDRAIRLLERISPVHHTRTDAQVERYQVEPYVVAADIYGVPPHVGRGGWTWYTGSAGWMLRVGLDTILGITVEAGRWLVITPRIPSSWPGYHVRYRPLGGATVYEIDVVNPVGSPPRVTELRLDGRMVPLDQGRARIEIDGRDGVHHVEIVLGHEDQAPLGARAEGTAG